MVPRPITRHRPVSAATLTAIALAMAEGAAAQSAPPAKAATATRPTQSYVIVQAEHADEATPGQVVTVQCPQDLRVVGAGFSAVIRNTPAKDAATGGSAKDAYHEEGLDNVRSFPNAAGAGWQVSGVSPGALATKQPWHLVVRAVCARIAP